MDSVDLSYLVVWNTDETSNNIDVTPEGIKNAAKFNADNLLKNLYECPREVLTSNITAFKVPEPVIKIPRIRPYPKPKQLTKWEKFAKEKGIQKRKKDPLIWDDNLKEWRPRFGFNKKDNINDKWVVETPLNYKPGKDINPIDALKNKYKENKDKNELNRLKNIKASQKLTVNNKSNNLTDIKNNKVNISKKLATKQINQIHVSTASAGKFQKNLKKTKKIKVSSKEIPKFTSNTETINQEVEHALNLFKKISKK